MSSSPYKRVRALFPDHHGLPRGKYIPIAHAEEGTGHATATFALALDRTMTDAPGARLLTGIPDCRLSFDMDDVRPSWQADTGVVVGDLSIDGAPFAISPRHALKRSVDAWGKLGYDVSVGIELEAFVMQPDGAGGWTEWDTPGAFVYGTGPSVDPVGLFDEIMETADSCGLPVETINSEYDTPQFELTLRYGEALKHVDDVFLFKLMAREIAAKHGLLLTYLGKPFGDRGGSGLHVNFSFTDESGVNPLLDADAPDGLSQLAHGCVGGLIDHHEGMAALLAPTVNSYKRLTPGALAGCWANWGHDHRGVTTRVPIERNKATRLEHRMADAAANPYLATATVLHAARLGFVAGSEAPPPEELDCLENQSTDRHVPSTLSAALDALEADVALVEAVGSEIVANFVANKRFEWEKFSAAVTDWELDYYLPFL